MIKLIVTLPMQSTGLYFNFTNIIGKLFVIDMPSKRLTMPKQLF